MQTDKKEVGRLKQMLLTVTVDYSFYLSFNLLNIILLHSNPTSLS